MFFDSRSEKQEIAGESRLAFMSNDCTDIVGHDVSHRPDDPDTLINIDPGRATFIDAADSRHSRHQIRPSDSAPNWPFARIIPTVPLPSWTSRVTRKPHAFVNALCLQANPEICGMFRHRRSGTLRFVRGAVRSAWDGPPVIG